MLHFLSFLPCNESKLKHEATKSAIWTTEHEDIETKQ